MWAMWFLAASASQVAGLSRPFEGEFGTTAVFDHSLSTEGHTAFWGSEVAGRGRHLGYDWSLPFGTPVLAAASGTVIAAGTVPSFVCPLTGRAVSDQVEVKILHPGAGVSLLTKYVHLSEVAVSVGDLVTSGQVVGQSGDSGCSSGPHLHFETWRVTGGDLRGGRPIDPYGWTGSSPDPWLATSPEAPSEPVWAEGQAPVIFRERVMRAAELSASVQVGIWKLRWMGEDDDAHPNNERVIIQTRPGPSVAEPVDMSGWALENEAGERFVFPAGTSVSAGSPVEVRSGVGQSAQGLLFWGRSAPVWDDLGDQAILYDEHGELQHRLSVGRASRMTTPP